MRCINLIAGACLYLSDQWDYTRLRFLLHLCCKKKLEPTNAEPLAISTGDRIGKGNQQNTAMQFCFQLHGEKLFLTTTLSSNLAFHPYPHPHPRIRNISEYLGTNVIDKVFLKTLAMHPTLTLMINNLLF